MIGALAAGFAADQDSDWKKAYTKNSTASYSEYLRKYPGASNAPDAKHRVDNLHYAFFISCWMGTVRATDGFIESHPNSSLTPVMREFREYLASLGSVEKARALLSAQPGNRFAPLARVRIPGLYLEAAKAKVGINVDVGYLVYRGIFSKGPDSAKIRTSEVDRIKKKLAAFDITGVDALLPAEDTSGIPVTHLLSVQYDEKVYRHEPGPYDMPKAPIDDLAEALSILTFGEIKIVERRIRLDLAGIDAPVYSEIDDLGRPAKLADPARALKSLGVDASAMPGELLMDSMRGFRSALQALATYGREADIEAVTAGIPPALLAGPTGFAVGSAAVRNSDVKVLASLLKNGLPADSRTDGGRSLLMDAITERRYSRVGVLLEAKAKPDGVDSTGRSALHMASGAGSLEGVKLLVKAGADPNLLDSKGVSPLLIAAESKPELLEVLLGAAGDLNARGADGSTPLIRVIKSGNVASASRLIRLGADPNVKSTTGDPPLVIAAAAGRADLVKALREAGATTENKDSRGRTALDVAMETLQPDMVTVLTGSLDMGREIRAWRLVKDGKDPELLEGFIQRFPNSVFRKSAEERLAALKK